MGILNLSPEPDREKILADNYELAAQTKRGASWFYWIAGLSLINSLIFLFGGNWSFFAGLGITQVIDEIVDQISRSGDFSVIKIIAFIIDLMIAAVFLLCGLWANKFKTWAFIVGMVLYFLDGVFLLVIGAYLPAAFHAFALFMIFRGLSAARQINASRNSAVS
ncbi:MAG: hypothetical protein ABJA66_06550 [Actinomycetota bacterium]